MIHWIVAGIMILEIVIWCMVKRWLMRKVEDIDGFNGVVKHGGGEGAHIVAKL